MMQKYTCLFLLILFSSCSVQNIHEWVYQGKKQTIYAGFFHGIEYLVIESKVKRKPEYKLRFVCHTPSGGQSLSKFVDNVEWWAVTDTIPNTFFLEKELNVERVVRPLTFLPITKEEIELLQIGIEKSDGCNSYSAEPLSKIIGYVKTTLVYKH